VTLLTSTPRYSISFMFWFRSPACEW